MAAPCGPWNSRDLIPPPTNFLKINLARLTDEKSHCHDDLKLILHSVRNGRDLNGSLLKGELVTLSRFLYKNKNSQRNWKLYGLLVKLKKCLERLATTSIHSYTGTMLSAWDEFPDPSTPVISLPSRQMLEYLCVGLQGCAKLCIYIASLCEQAALLTIETLHNGIFLSSNLVFLAIVSRVRVLICNFFKSAVGWYDNLVTVRSSLPSTNSEWLPKDTKLPLSLLEWLGDEASRLTLDVTSSKNASELSLLDRLFNTSLEVSLDMTDGGEREVTAVSQLLMSTGLEVKRDMTDGGEWAVTAVSQQPTETGLEIKMDTKDVGEQEVTKVSQRPTGTGLEVRMDMRGGDHTVTSIAKQPTDNSIMVRMDTEAKGEWEVTVSSQQSKNMPATLPDLGEKLSQAEVAFLVRDRRKQGYHQPKENETSKRKKDNGRINTPPRKRRKTKVNTSQYQSEEEQSPKVFKQKVKVGGLDSKIGWPMKKLVLGSDPKYSRLADNTPSISSETKRSKKRSKGKGLASSILTTVSVQGGKVCRRTSTSQKLGVPSIRRSVSQESSSAGHSCASRNIKRGMKLQQCIAKMKHKKKNRSNDNSRDWNSLVIKNSDVSCTPNSAFPVVEGSAINSRSADKTINKNSLFIRNTAASCKPSSTYLMATGSSHSLKNGRNRSELFMSSPGYSAGSYEGKKSRTSISSATQKPALDNLGYSQHVGRGPVHPTKHMPLSPRSLTKGKCLPDAIFPQSISSATQKPALDTLGYSQHVSRGPVHRTKHIPLSPRSLTKGKCLSDAIFPQSRLGSSIASTKQASTLKPAGTVSTLGFKKRKLVKRLKKLKQKLIGKGRTAPESTLHYANQMNVPRSTPLQIQQQQHFNLLPRNQYQHHGQSREPQYDHHESSILPHHHQGNKQRKDVPHKKHRSKKIQQAHPLPPSNHNLSQKTFKKKRQKSHGTPIPVHQGLVLNQKRKNHKRKMRDTDHDMDSIFASLL